MLLVDDRIGSRDLLRPLQLQGVPCELQRLEFADFAFIGRGIAGADVFIGIELKETKDLLASLQSNRFAGHQLIGLQSTYDRVWLLTEGIWRANQEGVLEYFAGGWKPASGGRRRIMACDLDAWILTQVIRGGLSHWHTGTRQDTLRFLGSLYRWWTNKALDEHRSHEVVYHPPPDRAMLTEPSTFLKMASCLPGVGWEKASALEEYCNGSVRRLVNLTAQDMLKVNGIGTKLSTKIHSALGEP